MPTVHVNGVDLFYEDRGRGPCLLFIPGLGGDITDYERVIDGLTQSLRVVGLDNRGSGQSGKPDVPYTIEMMADDAAALVRSLDLGRVHVLGHSMGGRVALDLALRYPESVASLILVSTSARVPPDSRRGVGVLGALWRKTPLLRRLDRHPQPYYAFRRQFEASRSYDATGRLTRIAVPTLIIQGSRDRLAPPPLVEEMRSRIRGSEVVTLPGGHLLLFMQPAACAGPIRAFVGRQRPVGVAATQAPG